MRREDFFRGKRKESMPVALFHVLMIVFLMGLFIVSLVLTSSCSGLTITDDRDKEPGLLLLSFAREEGVKNLLYGSGYGGVPIAAQVQVTGSNAREIPDTNSFYLSIKKSSGEILYSGKYSERPGELKLSPGSYDVRVESVRFEAPAFDMPCYSDSATVVVESGKVAKLSFLCRMSNGAVKLGFTQAFRERFPGYSAFVEDSKGRLGYPYSESRYLYLTPGEVFLKMKSVSDSFLLTRKLLRATEMVTVNLHSSLPGGDTGGGTPGDGSDFYSGILIDTASVWLSEDLVVGERRDGSTRELALTVEEIAAFVGQKGVWVSGYIAGFLTTASLVTVPPFGTETNIAVSSVKGQTDKLYCAGVSLPAGEIREALNLKSNPGNLGKRVWVKGTIVASYFGLAGVNPVTDFHLE